MLENRIANYLAKWCFKKCSIENASIIEVAYGIELFLNSVLKGIGLLLIAAVLGRIPEMVIAIGCFALLRKFAGGLHMKSSMGCFLGMLSVWLLSEAADRFLPIMPILVTAGLYIVLFVLIYIYAPYTTENNPIHDEKIISQKKTGSRIIIILLAVAAVILRDTAYGIYIIIPSVMETLSILPILTERKS